MGQRNMTYVISEVKYGKVAINTIYNQRNYIEIQLPKLVRGIKAVQSIQYSTELFMTFFAGHGLSPDSGWVGGHIEDEFFEDGRTYDAPFQEDNNNGWNIVKIKQLADYSVKIEVCHLLGREDADEEKGEHSLQPIPTRDYFSRDIRGEEEEREEYRWSDERRAEYLSLIDFLEANTKFNPKLKIEAENLLYKKIQDAKNRKVRAAA
jgi:hypothetical protein